MRAARRPAEHDNEVIIEKSGASHKKSATPPQSLRSSCASIASLIMGILWRAILRIFGSHAASNIGDNPAAFAPSFPFRLGASHRNWPFCI
jgi:hypothetical protein